MATYFVDDGGDGSDGLSWETAYTSINALDTAVALASGDLVYFGADSQCQATNSADLTITGPAANPPVRFISSTVGTGTTVVYEEATGNQIDTSEGYYDIFFNGAFHLTGMRIKAGGYIYPTNDNNESFFAEDCYFLVGDDGAIAFNDPSSGYSSQANFVNCTLDLTTDTPTCASAPLQTRASGEVRIQGLAITNGEERAGYCLEINDAGSLFSITGLDCSSLANLTALIDYNGTAYGNQYLANCKIPAGLGLLSRAGAASLGWALHLSNVGSAYSATQVNYYDHALDIVQGEDVYRTGGYTVGTTPASWLVEASIAGNSFGSPGYSPWIYQENDATGEKTFDVFIVNDTGDFNDDAVWLEVEFPSTASEPQWALAHNRAKIAADAAALTDDTTSTWNGTGPSFTYMQKLSVTATVAVAGPFRARVAVAAASLSGTDNFYIDPVVVVS